MISKSQTLYCSGCEMQLPTEQFINTGQGAMHKCNSNKMTSAYLNHDEYNRILRINRGDDKLDTLKQGAIRDYLHGSALPLEELKVWFETMDNRVSYGRNGIKLIYQEDINLGKKILKELKEKLQ